MKIEGENTITASTSCINFEPTELSKGTIKYGSYGDAPQDIAEKSGMDTYNVELTNGIGMKSFAVLIDNGSHMIRKSFFDQKVLEELTWISNEQYDQLLEEGNTVDAISCPYKMQPKNKVSKWFNKISVEQLKLDCRPE